MDGIDERRPSRKAMIIVFHILVVDNFEEIGAFGDWLFRTCSNYAPTHERLITSLLGCT